MRAVGINWKLVQMQSPTIRDSTVHQQRSPPHIQPPSGSAASAGLEVAQRGGAFQYPDLPVAGGDKPLNRPIAHVLLLQEWGDPITGCSPISRAADLESQNHRRPRHTQVNCRRMASPGAGQACSHPRCCPSNLFGMLVSLFVDTTSN